MSVTDSKSTLGGGAAFDVGVGVVASATENEKEGVDEKSGYTAKHWKPFVSLAQDG